MKKANLVAMMTAARNPEWRPTPLEACSKCGDVTGVCEEEELCYCCWMEKYEPENKPNGEGYEQATAEEMANCGWFPS